MRNLLKFSASLLVMVSLIISMVVPGNVAHAKGNEVTVKIMSYNIAHGAGMDGVLDLQRIADVIRDSRADIIGLQEVDRHWSARSNFVDQAKWLAESLDMHYVYAANLDRDPVNEGDPRRQYGTAVLSKYPIIHSENHLLTEVFIPGGHDEQRGLLETVINVKGNHLRFFNTHLSLKKEERDVSVEEILEIVNESDKYSVLVGDLNARPDYSEIIRLTEHYHDVFAELGKNDAYTYPAPYVNPNTGKVSKPTNRIDFILSDKNIEIKDANVIETMASDHIPIVGTFVLKRDNPSNNGNSK